METQKGSRRTAASRKLMVETASTGRTEAVVFWASFRHSHLASTEGQADISGSCVVQAKSGTMPEIEP